VPRRGSATTWPGAEGGYDLILAADQSLLDDAEAACLASWANVETLQVELASREGIDALVALVGARHVEALRANAGHGLGKAFLEQDFTDVRHVIDTNITGTLYLLHKWAQMCDDGRGKILVTGSIAGFMPGSFQAVYNGTKAFVDSFTAALRNEMKDSGVTVTCLMPGATDTEFGRKDRLRGDAGRRGRCGRRTAKQAAGRGVEGSAFPSDGRATSQTGGAWHRGKELNIHSGAVLPHGQDVAAVPLVFCGFR
jgi:short-subunit dehydrogenase